MKIIALTLGVLTCGSMAIQAAEPGTPAPSCRVPTLSGHSSVDPSASRAKVVYLDFWASWCGPCAQSFPVLDQLQSELGGQGFEVIAINLDEEPQEALGFLQRHPVHFTIGADPEGRCPRLYGVKGMPTSYLIDRAGRIREVHEGFKTSDTAKRRAQIESLLSEPRATP
ncbi:TlpA disulfide reductase family protein [Thermochromatium tepidum]|uniref:Redoxin family protein n=1 Tax=Thermochromatium tepidum ATCC 43061 TaxID=316276 RepID=A0A6I6E5W1_THETI|nr:TlpA disulfide reductase family protein [Thermochromatium tepidum]QGU31868.1 redoxin family protein [Thermochromatium tepidum ATCC 43061]